MNQIFWTQEVEEAFEAMAAGDKGAMKVGSRHGGCSSDARPPLRSTGHMHPLVSRATAHALLYTVQAYNEKQVKQLTRLIEVTRTDLSKADRQKVGHWGWRSMPCLQAAFSTVIRRTS